MTVVVNVSLSPDPRHAEYVLRLPPNVEADLQRIVPTGDDVAPLLELRNPEGVDCLEVLRRSPTVSDVRLIKRGEGSELYAVKWSNPDDGLLGAVRGADGILLSAYGSERGWELEIQFESRDRFREFSEACRERGVEVNVKRVSRPSTRDETLARGLTPTQRETLMHAYRRGYFEIPRKVTLAELAEEEGVSSQAISERIRRGLNSYLQDIFS